MSSPPATVSLYTKDGAAVTDPQVIKDAFDAGAVYVKTYSTADVPSVEYEPADAVFYYDETDRQLVGAVLTAYNRKSGTSISIEVGEVPTTA